MSLAIMLNNDPETIANLEATMDILTLLSKKDYNMDWNDELIQSTIEELSDWFGDIYKILTDYTLFTQDENGISES